jgi:hypothetical protein
MAELLDQRIQLVISKGQVREIDEWRRRQPELPSRSEAIRRLIEAGLSAELSPMPCHVSSPLHVETSTLPMSGVWKRSHGRTSEAPPDERGGNRYVRPTATAPHSDSTNLSHWAIAGVAADERRNRTFTPRLERGRASNFAGDSATAARSAGRHAHPQRAFRPVNRCVSALS